MSIEAMKQALESLSYVMSHGVAVRQAKDILTAAIEQAEIEKATQEIWQDVPGAVNFGITPQREWQGLTEDDALQLLPVMPYEYEVDVEMILEFASAIEQALKENNNAV
jgi:hypothetical protein